MFTTDAHDDWVGLHKAEEGLKLSARSMSRMWVEPLFLQEHFCWFAKYRFA
jgi:hypothetical protein